MNFIETRGNDGQRPAQVPFSEAILSPMNSYGGIYVPEALPQLGAAFLEAHQQSDYPSLAKAVLDAFKLDIDPDIIDQALQLYRQFDDPQQPVPVVKLDNNSYVAELYHGPTRAFKDMALQPFGIVLSALAQARDEHYLILAATSGDTGPATLETFKNRPNVRVACLYPDGGTSDVQRLQMVTEDAANLKVIGIHGDFDDAQSALKRLLGSERFRATLAEHNTQLSAANSVNFGRIIFQQIYHIHSYLELVRQGVIRLGEKVYLNVPSGNFGNALGGYYAMKMGLPVAQIHIASNANNVLTEWIQTGRYDLRQRQVIGTTSPAMDILKSSNVERILFDLYGPERTRELMQSLDEQHYYQLRDDELPALQAIFAADYCTDEQALGYIRQAFEQGYLLDPHTATCLKTRDSHAQGDTKTILYSTAEWTKFSPTIAKALSNNGSADKANDAPSHDIDALKAIAERANTAIPAPIQSLFDKPIAQPDVIDKQDIEQHILDFIRQN